MYCIQPYTAFFYILYKPVHILHVCQERRRLARSRKHKANLAAEEERRHDIAVELRRRL